MIGAFAVAFAYESIAGMERMTPAPEPGAATGSPEIIIEAVEEN